MTPDGSSRSRSELQGYVGCLRDESLLDLARGGFCINGLQYLQLLPKPERPLLPCKTVSPCERQALSQGLPPFNQRSDPATTPNLISEPNLRKPQSLVLKEAARCVCVGLLDGVRVMVIVL